MFTRTDELAVEWHTDESQKQVDPCFLDFGSKDRSIFKAIREQRGLTYFPKGRWTLSNNEDLALYRSMEVYGSCFGNLVRLVEGTTRTALNTREEMEEIATMKKDFEILYISSRMFVCIFGLQPRPPLLASLLYIAALFSFQPAVVVLLSYGSDEDAMSYETSIATPLLCALYHGHSIQYLDRGK
ncbi:uncharacterized protein EAF01_004995 [Botrytis porri]|uniref:uncharacterized protein n=1 Tax=Botrytis porri TaxID=87229 RepID=UPI001901BBDD|nr:uncharacterized protein EAF01_004995 [Botrytis porri]KAF7907409.1 hypothetical protein EAF01_004995 [Botrytis porri]